MPAEIVDVAALLESTTANPNDSRYVSNRPASSRSFHSGSNTLAATGRTYEPPRTPFGGARANLGQAIARILWQQPADNTSLAVLGKTTGASARTLSRLFRNELGMTFYEWRTQLRIYHALVLLGDGHETTQTAYACGWATPAAS